jgi:hypothetical protein
MVTPITELNDMEALKQLTNTIALLRMLPKRAVHVEEGIFLYGVFPEDETGEQAEREPFRAYCFDGFAYAESDTRYAYLEYPEQGALEPWQNAMVLDYRYGDQPPYPYAKLGDVMVKLGEVRFSVLKQGSHTTAGEIVE